MEYQADRIWEPAPAHQTEWAPPPERKVDNRAYAAAALRAWADLARYEPGPGFDPGVVPFQEAPPARAASFPDLLN